MYHNHYHHNHHHCHHVCSLQWQLLAAVTLDIVGTVAFCKVSFFIISLIIFVTSLTNVQYQVERSSNNGTLPGPVDNTCGLEEGKDDEEEQELEEEWEEEK